MSNLLNDFPLVEVLGDGKAINASTDKGQRIMESMLLGQYSKSTNLKEYYMCFIAELDLLFNQVEEVYLGRFLEYAEGAQLDVIGEILKQPRSVELSSIWFGFRGAPNSDGMASAEEPALGGVFKDGNTSSSGITPLDDRTYRRVLKAKGILANSSTADINTVYYVVCVLLGRVPNSLSIVISNIGDVELRLARRDTTSNEIQLVSYMSKYFVPTGTPFAIRQV